jgi:hypothetical protein
MQQDVSRKRLQMPSPAMVVGIIALIVALTGTAFAGGFKLGKNSVGTKQLKSKAVTGSKIANNAVNGTKVANGSVTGADINLNALGTVPSAGTSASAGNANTVAGHPASCPGGTILIRGVCFDSSANGVVTDVQTAANSCASKGGYLPDPLELVSTKDVINLGSGKGSDRMYTDSYYANTSGSSYSTVFASEEGPEFLKEGAFDTDAKYICAYPLVR